MGYVPFFVVISGLVFLVVSLNYHTFRNYKNAILGSIARIQEAKKQVRADVDQLESLSVPELEGFCENLCAYLSGKLNSRSLDEKLQSVNTAFGKLYSEIESKHLQEEILKSINQNVQTISRLNLELKENQSAYEKLLAEKPYSYMGRLLNFQPVELPWECNTEASISS
jgi:hypothetical protein